MQIVVNMACGLANRMFQYTYYLYLKSLGHDAFVDFYRTAKLSHENVEWERIFPNADLPQASFWKIQWLGGGSDVFCKIRRRYLPFAHNVLQMPTAFDAKLPIENKGDQYVMGVFQNAKMADAVKAEAQKAFTFNPFEDGRNADLMREMQGCESVAIHVRKGKDYAARIWYQDTCPVKYYEDAVALLQEKYSNPKFYVFTDNPDWVKENLKGFEYKLVEGNPPAGWGSHFDMQLMSYCKHNIISNSTYAWWAAFLNKNVNKLVVCPEVWFNPKSTKEYTSSKVLCEGWITL